MVYRKQHILTGYQLQENQRSTKQTGIIIIKAILQEQKKEVIAHNLNYMSLHKLFLLALLACFFTEVKGQIIDTKKEIISIIGIGGTLSMPGYHYMWSLPEENQSFIFSALISVNHAGKITEVKFGGRSKLSDTTLKLDLIIKFLKQDKNGVFKKYKNSFFVVPIWMKGVGGTLVKTTPEFLKSLNELIPLSVYQIKDKKTYILPISVIEMYKPIH